MSPGGRVCLSTTALFRVLGFFFSGLPLLFRSRLVFFSGSPSPRGPRQSTHSRDSAVVAAGFGLRHQRHDNIDGLASAEEKSTLPVAAACLLFAF